ncbi:transcriptional regulator TbsP domain-containing protein [Halorarius litoreus]|uniref:transcriptional regulator TbsP domain-containing protein n=1 Tax=Halorarius litoreus TaxID=2962676 RepID=UPI0020CE5F18|nr:DUF5821 family protein [Halorarius litoreus]
METAHVGSLVDVLSAVTSESDDVAVVCAAPSTLVAVVDAVEGTTRERPVRVLAPAAALRIIDRDHVTAARLADLVATDALAVRTEDTDDGEPLVLTDERAVSLLTDLPAETVGVATDDADAVTAVTEGFDARWDAADEYARESPTYSELVASIAEAFDEATAADLEAAIATPGVRGLEDNLDLVDLLVLLTARHRHQLYELTNWGSEVGVASVGTFSQAKRRMEDIGLIDTETVHSGDVGRPRQRLVIGNEDLVDASVEELVAAAQSVLVD